MKIIYFASKNKYGALLLNQMKEKDIPLEAIFIENHTLRQQIKNAIRRLGFARTIRVALKRAIGIVVPKIVEDWLSNSYYLSYSDEVCIVDNFNGEQCEQLLKEIRPDLIVLGSSRIIRENILNIPRIGILNAHPGLLPGYRGVDTLEWAIYNGDNIGATLHFIDKGVDTGDILVREIINIDANDNIAGLTDKARAVRAKLMTENILKFMKGENIQVIPQSIENGEQYYKMPSRLLRETERRLQRITRELKVSLD